MKTIFRHITFHFSYFVLFFISFNQPGFALEYKDIKISSGLAGSWFKINGSDTIIPLFKISTTYYSVCRGFEIPLEETSYGYKWAVTPSSMEGTIIGYDKSSSMDYIAVMDNQASNFTDGKYGIGEKQFMTSIDEPDGIFDAITPAPKTIDSFLGIFQSVWLPGLRFEIRKENNKYYYDLQHLEHDSWKSDNKSQKIIPLVGKLDFTGFEKNNKQSLIYNEKLRRFEIISDDTKRQPSVLRMPLIKNPQSTSTKENKSPSPKLKFGIPSWN